MPISAYLYDAQGHDTKIEVAELRLAHLTESQLLWIDVRGPDVSLPTELTAELTIEQGLIQRLLDPNRGNQLDNYGSWFAFRVQTPGLSEEPTGPSSGVTSQILGFVVSQRWLITVHASDIDFLSAFQAQDKGETAIGALTPALLAASLLDWHLAEFFSVASRIEALVDTLDERILSEGADRPVLNEIVAARRRVGELRALISSQRPVFHGLTRPDFSVCTDPDAVQQFAALANRYDRAVDEVERSREVVVGSFDLFASMSSEETNDLVKALTFVTVIIGFSAAVAGLLGMNFDAPFFKSGLTGFIIATAGLAGLSIAAIVVARFRKWI